MAESSIYLTSNHFYSFMLQAYSYGFSRSFAMGPLGTLVIDAKVTTLIYVAEAIHSNMDLKQSLVCSTAKWSQNVSEVSN